MTDKDTGLQQGKGKCPHTLSHSLGRRETRPERYLRARVFDHTGLNVPGVLSRCFSNPRAWAWKKESPQRLWCIGHIGRPSLAHDGYSLEKKVPSARCKQASGPLPAGNSPATIPKRALSPNQNQALPSRSMPDPIRKVPGQPTHPFWNDPLQVDKA